MELDESAREGDPDGDVEDEPDPHADRRFDELIDPPFNPITGSTGLVPQLFGDRVRKSSEPQTPRSFIERAARLVIAFFLYGFLMRVVYALFH